MRTITSARLVRPFLVIALGCLLPLAGCGTPKAIATPSNDEMFSKVQNYERFMGWWSRPLASQLIEFGGVADGDHILDVGTGTGALASELLANGPRIRVRRDAPHPPT